MTSNLRHIRFVTAHRGGEDSFKSSPLYRSLNNRYDLAAKLNNTEGLPKVYNLYLRGDHKEFAKYGPWETVPSQEDIVVFLHDDVEMMGNNVETELNRWANEGFAILGLAGAVTASISSPAIWNRMSQPEARSGWSIFHNMKRAPNGAFLGNDPDQPYPGRYGPLRRVLLLDGLFIAVVQHLALPTGWLFDEDFDFHHYDLASCLNANRLGLKLRTVFVPVIHWSIGLQSTEDPVWQRNEAKFLEKFGPKDP